MVITLLAGIWAVFFVILLENLACWRGKIRWSSKELWEKEKGCLILEEMGVEGIRNGPSLALRRFCHLPLSAVQRGPAPAAQLLFPVILLAVSWVSAQRMPQSQQDCFCVEKAEPSFLACHQKRGDFLTKTECSIRRDFGSLPCARKPGEWFEFFQNCLKFSC